MGDSLLLRAADPILANLADDLEMDRASLLVADRHARILRTWTPDAKFSHLMERIGSTAGHSGAEEIVGTNGIGTTAEDRRPQMIVGAEHISDVLTDFACVGAPVYNPITRRLQGVITLTARVEDASPLLPGLISHAAREVGRHLLNLSSARERVLLDAFIVASKSGRAVAVVGADILLENPSATAVLRAVDQITLWAMVSESTSLRHPKSRFHIANDTALTEVRCTAVVFDDEMIGAIVEIVGHASNEPVPERPSGPASNGWPPLSKALPGTSPAWVSTLEQAESATRAAIPVVVFGANGTGKLTLLTHMLGRAAPRRAPVIVDARDPVAGSQAWLTRLTEALSGTDPVILRHIDDLASETAQLVADQLTVSDHLLRQGLFCATSRAEGVAQLSPGHEALLGLIAVGRIDMPNLRERRQDLREILRLLERKYTPGRTFTFTQGAYNALSRAPWPGNVRQLDSVMRGVFAAARRNEITVDQLPPTIGSYATRRDLSMLEQLEVDGIINALVRCAGNKVIAAEMLGISRSTLYRKMSTYRLDAERMFL
ncbi:hypothetical protein M4I32_14950 [Microbacterium sp. LRZ72]|uniref:sigma-54-dependent Fis family transcriptional regulator n=1 Tax=Microbacterium sp. LRZ72 TaxID=2942481 RepID=UPI0029A819A0|nr:helix-turn-helix domain-containing protein [Microbacterium sp. LRZ72]MDX2378088.1 hypothetical protein [Microbacterium sp. LRZ72]